MCLCVYECALLERWCIFCVTFPALAFSCLFTVSTVQWQIILLMPLFILDFVKVRRQTESGVRDVYQDVMSYCVLGTARYREELAHASGFSVSSAFARDVCQLPYTYEASLYRSFIDKWGTVSVNTYLQSF